MPLRGIGVNIMPEIIKREELYQIYSEEMQEIVGQAPKGIVRWGSTVFLIVLLIILSVSWFVKYADVIVATVTINANNAPKSVLTKTDAKLIRLFTAENNYVKNGEILAYMESTADHQEVIRLTSELDNIWLAIRTNKWEKLIEHDAARYKQLGELQSAYQTFITSFIQLQSYLRNGTYVQKKLLLQKELSNLHELHKSLLTQQSVLYKDYEIASKDFSAKEQLYKEKVIPLLEYKQEQSKYLNKLLPLENLQTSLINSNTSTAEKQQEILALEQQFTDQKSGFLQVLNTLISSIDSWKKQYLLIAPVAGRVTFPTIIHENQDVKIGQDVFYITPENAGYYGELQVGQESFGKVQIGQEVLISLASYPYEEYGKLEGNVVFISKIPNKEGLYQATVKLSNGLKSDNKTVLSFKNGMSGGAEIIAKKTRLLNKFLFTINKLLYKPVSKGKNQQQVSKKESN